MIFEEIDLYIANNYTDEEEYAHLCSKFYNITKCSSNIEFIISSYAMEDFDYKNKFKILLFSEEEYECGCKK